jgi:hypothetical protein
VRRLVVAAACRSAGRKACLVLFGVAALCAARDLFARPGAVEGAAVSSISSSGAEPTPLAHTWHLVEGRHWQIVSTAAVEDVATTDAAEGTRGRCPPGMVQARGQLKLDGWGDYDGVDALQKTACVDWIDRNFPERCGRFDPDRWSTLAKKLPTRAVDFCIDRFEYPNRRGAYPWILVDWNEARAICARESKRLCTEAEWTFACEGDDAMPHPYGYERDREACVIDRAWRQVDASALFPRDTERAVAELDRLWQGEPSGSRPRCRSPVGVYDMTGNIDEWTTSVIPEGNRSILKGGYWGPVRTRCRPSTRIHGEDFAYYQQGLRCCADVPR